MLLRFATFELDLQSGELRKAGRVISLPPQPFKILALLASRQGELLTREEIQREIWGDGIVVDFDRGLNFAMNKIRAALSDSAGSPRFIETLPRRGYRFLCPVERVGEPAAVNANPMESPPPPADTPNSWLRVPRSVWFAAAGLLGVVLVALAAVHGWNTRSGPVRVKSVAVLPFENLSHNPADDYLSDGAADLLITELGRVSAIRVISRTSTARYKKDPKSIPEVGRELSVDFVVEGAVLHSADRMRITVQLKEAATDRHLWAESYERKLGDVLTLQGEVARNIAGAVQVRITPKEREQLTRARSVDPQAYELYLQGRFFWNKQNVEALNKSIASYQAALRKDPDFALAYAGLADSYAALPYTAGTPAAEAYGKAKKAATKALELDPNLVEAVNVLGEVAGYEWHWAEAEKQYQRALSLNPSYAQTYHDYGFIYLAKGRVKETMKINAKSRLLDPLSVYFATDHAQLPYFLRQNDEAIRQLRTVVEMDPTFASTHLCLALALRAKGQHDLAIQEALKAVELDPASPLQFAILGYVYASAGKKDLARKQLEALQRMAAKQPVSAFFFGFIYLGLGDKDRVFELFSRACDERFYYMAVLNLMPESDPLRSDPRFGELVKRIGLPQ